MRLAEVRDAHFMAISEHSQADLETHCQVPSERIHLALEGANWDLFKPERADHRWAEVRDKLALPDTPFFLVLNTLEPRKNLKGTIEGFLRCLADCDADLHLVVAGAVGWKPESLPADDHRKHPNIHFVGFVDDPDLPVLYTRALALCYLSFYEGFGLPPLEAMSCGAPVIGGDNSSLPEVIGDGGLLVNAQSHEAIAEAMTRVAHDEALRTVLSEKARKQAHRFSWTRMAWLTMRAHLQIVSDKTNQTGAV
jgi:glycosyltransferase involved in cell wall biosynthesis